MAQYQPIHGVGHMSMKKYFPNWTAAEPHTASQPVDNPAEYSEYTEFILSANWVLRPAGLKKFYNQIRQAVENPEITYEVDIGCFRIRCHRDEQHNIVTACNKIMDELVKDEIQIVPEEEQLIFLGTSNSDMVRSISEWRAEVLQEAELKQYEVFSYPSKIASSKYQGTWTVPKDKARPNLRIQSLFLSCDPTKLLSETTGCTVAEGINGLSLHFGACSAEQIIQAKRKMDNIMKYYDLDSQLGLQRNVVFVEDNAIVHVELRYIAQTDRRYLRNAVFDPTKFQLSHSYEKLFEKGSWLRSMKREKGSLVLAASPLTSAVQQTHVTHPFEPFTDWTVARKDQQWDLAVSAMGITQTLPMLDDDRLKLVNPQAAPRVLEWATTLPPFNNSSIREECSVTNHTASLTLEVPDIGAISTNEELITINDVQETETPVITSYVGSMLQPVEAAGPALYQSRSLMTSSPQATDGSSLYADRPKYVSPCFNSPGPIKGKPLPSEASGFDDVDPIGDECEQHHNKIKATLLATCILRPTVNASLASHSPEKVSYGQANSPDDELFGEVFSPSGNRQDTPRQETFDLLSASPREFASGSQLLTPILTSFTQNSTLSGEKMIPKAPVPRSKQCSRGIDSRTREKICDYIFQMLEPLRFYRGIVSMRVEIGKFWFTKINWQHISIPGLRQISKAKTIEDMEKSLEKHAVPRDMYFNNIFSLFSGDANLVSNVLGDDEVSKMWLPNSRTAVYEFWCMTKTATGLKTYFSLEVDARTFQYKLRREGTQESNVYVHCAKRDFDFRVVVDATSDIRESYEPFAREVVSSLKVTPCSDGSNPPHLEFVNFRGWKVDIKSVRYKQIASLNNRENTCKLHITHVHCMSKKTVKESDSIWYLSSKPTLGDPNEGRFPAWFEAHITSDRANNALEENSSLGFAEEAAWTPEDLQDSGAIDDLLQSAANTVKRMDGVGFWVNNLQDNMRFGQPPHTMADAQEQANAYGPAQRYW